MFKKLQQKNQGFTLVEVLVAILITTLFVGVAMQSIVIAVIFKARAQESVKATTWIQEDLEGVKYKATKLQHTSLIANAAPTDIVLQLASVDEFQAGDTLIVGTDSTDNTIAVGGINSTAKTITLTGALGSNWLANTEVSATTKCPRTDGTAIALDEGFAKYLQDNLPALSITNPNTGSRNTLGKTYTLTRTPTIKDIQPYAVLELNYSYTRWFINSQFLYRGDTGCCATMPEIIFRDSH